MSERGQTPTGGQPLPGRQPLPGAGAPGWPASFIRQATVGQRLGLAAFALICIGLIALAASIARHPQYAVLYANLDQEDAGEVVQRLRDLKAPYRVTAAGTIEAPADRIHELRLDLAAEGLPAGGQTGFELFDRARLGISDFGEKLNYQRALQGELARTIAHLDSVDQARVHLALPPERLYASDRQEPTASVVLKLRGARRLTPHQVRSIVHLVSGAVEGLSPESVALLDTEGRLLSSPDDSGPNGPGLAAASNQLQLRRDYERQVEEAVQSMLDGVLGPQKSVVRVSALLSFDSVERESETYQPAADGSGVLESRRETRETYRGLGEPPAVGVPGITSNTVPASPGTSASAAQPLPGEADHYDHTDIASEYRISRQRERVIQPPGQLKQLSLSVFIDQEADLGDVEAADLTTAVSAAAGLDPERGDTVVITRVPFQPAPAEQSGGRAFAIRDFYYRVGRDFIAIVLMVLFLRFVLSLLRRRTARSAIPQTDDALGGQRAVAQPAYSTASAPGPAAAPAGSAEIDPDRAAAVLKSWLSDEGSSQAARSSPGGDGRSTTAVDDDDE